MSVSVVSPVFVGRREEIASLAALMELVLGLLVRVQLAAMFADAPAPGVTDVVCDCSGGNAYLVEELAAVVRGDGDMWEAVQQHDWIATTRLGEAQADPPDCQEAVPHAGDSHVTSAGSDASSL
jgi:hypothetical protein